ncbi:MFS transporter [Nonomuraea endophytica]|uniref:MFS family permease n=1 Tax=Nonomuraea endophytica TaxID=714136 RepID=A0A7W8ELW4_9ACTN|nr:MFS transporter [Nonomuraea endophytica]MBB5084071.1 MFS family permease [Nonomuraea endophytica]
MTGLTARRFAVIWSAELVSVICSSLTAFVLSVWVYQESGSETQFALNLLCATLPGLLIGPFAGVIVDRFDRRRVLVLADAGAALATAVLAVLAHTGNLQVWHVYPATAVAAICGTFHVTVYQAMTPLLVPERHLGRVNGLMQTTFALQVAAPIVAGALMEAIGLRGVFVLDLLSFVLVACVVLSSRLPAGLLRPSGTAPPNSFRADLVHGFARLRTGGLLGLVGAFTVFTFVFASAGMLIRPLILAFASPATLGALVFAGGAGLFAGSLAMGAWGGPRRKVVGAGIFMGLGGVALAAHALSPSVLLIAVVAPLFLFTIPVVNACFTTVIQSSTEAAEQGRVLASARTLTQAAMPLAYLAVAPLTERLAEPALMPGGALAGSVGALIGTGEGRGIALVFLLDGALLVVLAVVTLAVPRLRGLGARPEEEPATVT